MIKKEQAKLGDYDVHIIRSPTLYWKFKYRRFFLRLNSTDHRNLSYYDSYCYSCIFEYEDFGIGCQDLLSSMDISMKSGGDLWGIWSGRERFYEHQGAVYERDARYVVGLIGGELGAILVVPGIRRHAGAKGRREERTFSVHLSISERKRLKF
ncbi:hypothetical protein Tco_0573431 [Tanacetum coccineum]